MLFIVRFCSLLTEQQHQHWWRGLGSCQHQTSREKTPRQLNITYKPPHYLLLQYLEKVYVGVVTIMKSIFIYKATQIYENLKIYIQLMSIRLY